MNFNLSRHPPPPPVTRYLCASPLGTLRHLLDPSVTSLAHGIAGGDRARLLTPAPPTYSYENNGVDGRPSASASASAFSRGGSLELGMCAEHSVVSPGGVVFVVVNARRFFLTPSVYVLVAHTVRARRT